MADALTEIFRAASKHPNSRVSKLIQTVEDEPTQKNIVLLLIELAEHAEYSTDFNVSLKYYLDFFERLGIDHDLVLNEAGLLLVNSSKIYAKRVDYVQSLVERQILTLSNADDELQKQKLEQQQQSENAAPVEKPKRGRKRVLEAPSDPFEVELLPKKFKKISEEKRFAVPKTAPKVKCVLRNIEMEQHIHPAGWQHATIYDLENEEDVDTKRNYKLFTYHVEHRYNTLVPDINFRLHFKVKDYMDEQEEMEEDEACNTDRSWPPLSEAYVLKYLRLENFVLQKDIKSIKRKTMNEEFGAKDKTKENEKKSTENVNTSNDSTVAKNNSKLEQKNNDLERPSEIETQCNLDSSNFNEKNDSGLGQSLLYESNTTLENTQLNLTVETSTNQEDLNQIEASKSLNSTGAQAENDSALCLSVLNQSNNTENETTTENTGNLNSTETPGDLFDANTTDTNKLLNTTEIQAENESGLGASILDQTSSLDHNATTDTNGNSDTRQGSLTKTTETSGFFETSLNKEEGPQKDNVEELSKATENRKDSALGDDQHHSASTENLAMSRENLNKIKVDLSKKLEIDVVSQQDKDATQIRVQLPQTDDEGVYLSDLEEHDFGLLSPIVKVSNILPGVKRKDVTIIMDEELRQALEMRDGIIEHFSHETYKVPVITEPKKQNLVFNILQLPEKHLRRKVIFKLGPDMDLYLQARSMKRSRPEPAPRYNHNIQLMQWFSLNNTDMSGVCMTPPNSPGHCSDFCGFSDEEDGDAISFVDFFGFTEEEQALMIVKHGSRLSRDSGVGVENSNLAQEKETLEIILEGGENSVIERCNKNLNINEAGSTESILNQLPAEIRDVLVMELEGGKETATQSESTEIPTSSKSTEETEKLCTENSIKNSEPTEICLTKNSQEDCSESTMALTSFNITEDTDSVKKNSETLTTDNCSTNNTQDSDVVLTENSTGSQNCTENGQALVTKEAQDTTSDNGTETLVKTTDNTDVEMSSSSPSNADEKKCIHDNDSDDIVMLDFETQGTKTKIQQWHEHLQPILAKSRERHHFDVFKLGTEIIDTVQSRRQLNDQPLTDTKSTSNTSSQPVATFHDVMNNKEHSYVSRYFLSTLLLANQSNIEISISNKSSERPSSWHDIQIKLLSSKRHTVAIEDNIGMIEKKQKASNKNQKPHSKQNQNETPINQHEDEDEPLIKLQNSKIAKPSLKRSNDSATSPIISVKKPKEITSLTYSRNFKLPHLIESVQIIAPPFAKTPLTMDYISMTPSTSRQAQVSNNALFNVNNNAIRTLQPIEKVQKRSDDYDSGIFSIDEMSTS